MVALTVSVPAGGVASSQNSTGSISYSKCEDQSVSVSLEDKEERERAEDDVSKGDTINNNSKISKSSLKHFKFIYSVEFSRLHQQYLVTAGSGDVNRMAQFLYHNPHHPEGKGRLYSDWHGHGLI